MYDDSRDSEPVIPQIKGIPHQRPASEPMAKRPPQQRDRRTQ